MLTDPKKSVGKKKKNNNNHGHANNIELKWNQITSDIWMLYYENCNFTEIYLRQEIGS